MSLNSFVTAGGAEIGRAKAMQAAAAGIEPHARMNPVLLKPGSDRRSQVVLLGHPVAEVDAVGYRGQAAALLEVALDSLSQLRRDYDVVICEGAGSGTARCAGRPGGRASGYGGSEPAHRRGAARRAAGHRPGRRGDAGEIMTRCRAGRRRPDAAGGRWAATVSAFREPGACSP
jgi:hypothetical protein